MNEVGLKLINFANLEMICTNCGHYSSIFYSSCDRCFSKLIPLEFYNYFKFKKIYEEIINYSLISEEIILKYLKNINIGTEADKKYLINYFKYFSYNFLYRTNLRYFHNLKQILKLDYIYGYDNIKNNEINNISDNIIYLINEKEAYSQTFDKYYDFKDIFYYATHILNLFSQDIIIKSEFSEIELLINKLVLDSINEIIKKVKIYIQKNEKFKNIIKFRRVLQEFNLNEKKFYKTNIAKFLDSKQYDNIIRIINEYEMDLLYLPIADTYVIVKNTYTPNVKHIIRLNEEKGGINFDDLITQLKTNALEAEIIIQILSRRKLLVKTHSYRQGDQYYIK